MNSSQFMPYNSADMSKFKKMYQELEVVFKDFFVYCRKIVRVMFRSF